MRNIKILAIILILCFFASCNKYARENYPNLASKTESYQYVNSCFSEEVDDINNLPILAKNNIQDFFKNRLTKKYYDRLEFKIGYVLSDKPIEIERSESEKSILALLGQNKEKAECDTILAFPIYSVIYELKIPEIGIENVGLNLMLNKNGDLIKDIDFPKSDFANMILPIDSVHSELIRRKIPSKKLNIDLLFDKKNQSFVWSANTLIREGSIFGPSCFPEVEYHFKMNAETGKITNFDYEKITEYFAESE
ncbi:hypothetical protein JCM19297_2 [Nonlabens ulvanivorans]|nr:hypothetical protein JCM19297_2 [Nonlabens ulvanivorans]